MNSSSDGFINSVGQLFEKFPALPDTWRETLVKITPVLALIFGILGILVALGGLGLLTALSPLAFLAGAPGVSSVGTGFMAMLIFLGASVLMLAAYPGTKGRKYSGWTLLFWSQVVNLIGGLLTLSSPISKILGAIIGFYLLFQIKSYYK
jgi:hypothetical protein